MPSRFRSNLIAALGVSAISFTIVLAAISFFQTLLQRSATP